MTEECCVCRGTHNDPENKLVSCNGQGCKVIVHQACYGIASLSTSGLWYCCKCVSQERAAKVKCELCPKRDGAYKRTDNGGWAHVVCALYIPEVSFGNTLTMEPIVTTRVPRDRLSKACYICEERGLEAFASVGACMPCNKQSCRLQFHVTCGQKLGLLCEEEDPQNPTCLVYCGYCETHWRKMKGRSDSGVSVSSSRGVTSRARSTSIDSPGRSGPGRAGLCESGPSAASSKLEAVEPSRKLVGHPTVKRRARGRKLSSSSEGSEGSEVAPSLISKETTKAPVDQCLTIAEEPSPLPHESSDAVLSLDEVTQDSLVAASATAEETTMDTDVAQLSAKAPSPRAGDTEDKSSSDSSSDDSSSSDSEASDPVEHVQLPAKEDMDQTCQMEAKTEPFSPSLSSVASPVNKTAQDESSATAASVEGKQVNPAGRGSSKRMKELDGTTPSTSPAHAGKKKAQASSALKGRGGAAVRGGRGSRPVRANGAQRNGSPAQRRPQNRSVKVASPDPRLSLPPPTTLEELLKRQWEETVSFLTQETTKQNNAASVVAELVSLQEENRKMEQRIVELSSQREFYRANNHRLQDILEANSGTDFLNGANSTGGHIQSIASVSLDNKPAADSLPTALGLSSGQDMLNTRQQGGQSSHSNPPDVVGSSRGGAPRHSIDRPSPIPGLSNVMWTSTSGGTPTRWTLSGWKQETFEPQSGLTPLTDTSFPKTTA